MRRKRIMIIGASRCGKTTLAHLLNEDERSVKRTQDIIYGKHTIDIPSSYMENPWMYKHIIAAAQDASHVLLLVDQSNCTMVYPHGFAKVFQCPVIGVISKADLNPENEARCVQQLQMAGVTEPYYRLSAPNQIGFAELMQCLFDKKQE